MTVNILSARQRRPVFAVAFLLSLLFPPGPMAPGGRPLRAAQFVRGDPNGDGATDIGDPVAILGFLFTGAASIACLDAADTDDSGALDLGDPVRLLGCLFLGGPGPEKPYPGAGYDSTPDPLDCAGEPDIDEGLAIGGFPPEPEDLALIEGKPLLRHQEAWGVMVLADPEIYDRLISLEPGTSIEAALGAEAKSLLQTIFASGAPAPEKPFAAAVDAIAPMGPYGCFAIPPSLIDGGSRGASKTGTFLRGDVDGNGEVETADARALGDCLAGSGPCPEGCRDAADADDDGEVGPLDVEAIALAAIGEIRLPPPWESCGIDSTPDGFPPCTTGSCADGRSGLRLSVEPEVICGEGPHPVELVATDGDGEISRAPCVVVLCDGDREDCPDSPQVAGSPPASGDPGGDPDRGSGSAGAPVACSWLREILLDPEDVESELRQNSYGSEGDLSATRHGLPIIATGAMDLTRTDNGPGPVHYLYGSRMGANCRTPPSQISLVKSGTLQIRINLFCVNSNGVVVSCPSEVELEGIYRSRVGVETAAGPPCLDSPNNVDALSQDEILLQANGESIIQKAVLVQNGNVVTSSASFSIEFGAGLGGEGLASNAGVKMGYSTTQSSETGSLKDSIEAFGNARSSLPLTVDLTTRGRVNINAFSRTKATARCTSKVAGAWLVAKTECPAEPLFICEIQGEEESVAIAKKMAEQFRKTRLGR